jgi:hypothetical protein
MKFKGYAFHKLSRKLRYQRMFAWSCPAKTRSVPFSKPEKLPLQLQRVLKVRLVFQSLLLLASCSAVGVGIVAGERGATQCSRGGIR